MIRKAFRASIFPGHHAEYERRHSPIWQELTDVLLRHGVRTYSIYLDVETDDLFGYVEVESEEAVAGDRDHGCVSPLVALRAGRSCRRERTIAP